MEYEYFLYDIDTPIRAISLLTDIICDKTNEDWGLFENREKREEIKELLALVHSIKLQAEYLCKLREDGIKEVDMLYASQKS